MEHFKRQLNEMEFYELQTVLDWAEQKQPEDIIEYVLLDSVKIIDTAKPLCLRKYPEDCTIKLTAAQAIALFSVMQKIAELDASLRGLSWDLHRYISETVSVPLIQKEDNENTKLYRDRNFLQLTSPKSL